LAGAFRSPWNRLCRAWVTDHTETGGFDTTVYHNRLIDILKCFGHQIEGRWIVRNAVKFVTEFIARIEKTAPEGGAGNLRFGVLSHAFF